MLKTRPPALVALLLHFGDQEKSEFTEPVGFLGPLEINSLGTDGLAILNVHHCNDHRWSHVRTLLVHRPFQFRNRHYHTVGKQRNTLGKLLSRSSATCALPCILSEGLGWSETERKLNLPRLSCDIVTIAQSIGKTIAQCFGNGHPEPLGFTEPVGRAWILWKDSRGTLGSRILIVSPVRCSLLIVERCHKSGRYSANKRSCAISASQPARRKWELVWSGSQKPRTPEFPSIIEMLGRVEEDPQPRTLAFFRVLTRTPSVGECTRFMHTLT